MYAGKARRIRRLNDKGEPGAAALMKQLGAGRSEDARALAYRLFAICERKAWADEALAYNGQTTDNC